MYITFTAPIVKKSLSTIFEIINSILYIFFYGNRALLQVKLSDKIFWIMILILIIRKYKKFKAESQNPKFPYVDLANIVPVILL